MAENHRDQTARTDADKDVDRRTCARMTLISEFHIESAFVGVAKLAKILGLAPTTIYGYMRAGKFFIPYRMFNTSPMVCIDDLVDWYCSRDDFFIGSAMPTNIARAVPCAEQPGRQRGEDEDPQQVADRIVANALAGMGISTPRAHRR